jgi:hypothetical protein
MKISIAHSAHQEVYGLSRRCISTVWQPRRAFYFQQKQVKYGSSKKAANPVAG